MSFPFYRNTGDQPPKGSPIQLPVSRRLQLEHPSKYKADVGLKDACNVALLLGQPLLLTGEAGTGKTVFAKNLAYELGLPEPLKFETKSNSTSQDLFYHYDALKRFQHARSSGDDGSSSALPYITYRPLGLAILLSREPQEVKQWLHPEFKHPGKSRSVVLIDEIDKAPRDFPNDLLNELELMYFRVPELEDAVIKADENLLPIIVITSNSEKDLPDAFLRRCVYYNISFPEDDQLREIVADRLGLHSSQSSSFIQDALDIFMKLRSRALNLNKRPATAELLGWMLALQQMVPENVDNPLAIPGIAIKSLSNLVKNAEDQERAMKEVLKWLEERPVST